MGTVDKIQGQEAPVVIYSMATARSEEAPRGMDRPPLAVGRLQIIDDEHLTFRLKTP